MVDEPDSLVLRQLRSMDRKLDRLVADLGDLKIRATGVEEGLAGVNRRLDRIEQRLDRVEKRLELTDEPYGGVRE